MVQLECKLRGLTILNHLNGLEAQLGLVQAGVPFSSYISAPLNYRFLYKTSNYDEALIL